MVERREEAKHKTEINEAGCEKLRTGRRNSEREGGREKKSTKPQLFVALKGLRNQCKLTWKYIMLLICKCVTRNIIFFTITIKQYCIVGTAQVRTRSLQSPWQAEIGLLTGMVETDSVVPCAATVHNGHLHYIHLGLHSTHIKLLAIVSTLISKQIIILVHYQLTWQYRT